MFSTSIWRKEARERCTSNTRKWASSYMQCNVLTCADSSNRTNLHQATCRTTPIRRRDSLLAASEMMHAFCFTLFLHGTRRWPYQTTLFPGA